MSLEFGAQSDSEDDDVMNAQSQAAAAKFGQMQAQKPSQPQGKKQFDSADHFSSIEQMRKDGQLNTGGATQPIPEGAEESKE